MCLMYVLIYLQMENFLPNGMRWAKEETAALLLAGSDRTCMAIYTIQGRGTNVSQTFVTELSYPMQIHCQLSHVHKSSSHKHIYSLTITCLVKILNKIS